MIVNAIDFETANASLASVCALGISSMEEGAVEEKYYSLIRPHESVSHFHFGNINVHGIRPSDVENAPSFDEIYPEIQGYFENAVIAAHNAAFDMNCLKQLLYLYKIPLPSFEYFDTVQLSKKVFPQLSHHRLNDMCEYMHIDLEHHHAGSDAYGCLMIVANIMNLANIYDIHELLRQCNVPLHTF